MLVRLAREAKARQVRHHYIERVFGASAVRQGIGKHWNELDEAVEGVRIAVSQDQRKRRWTFAAFVNEVDGEPVDQRFEMSELVEGAFLPAPIEIVLPIADQFFQIVDVGPGCPTGVLDLRTPAGRLQAPAQVVQSLGAHLDSERLNVVT